MIFTCLSNKNSPAPLVYVFLQICLLTGFGIFCPTILSVYLSPIAILFWIVSIFTLISYFYAHLRDPGYIPYDAVFLKDNGMTFSHAIETRRRVNSLMKLKTTKTRNTTETDTQICTTNPEVKEKICEINRNYLRRLQEGDGTSQISTNFGIMTNMATEILPTLEKKTEVECQITKYETEKQETNDEIEDNQYTQEFTDNVACEPSMEQGEESFQTYNINFGTGGGDEVEDVIPKSLPSNLEENDLEINPNFKIKIHRISKQKDYKKEKRKSRREKRRKIVNKSNINSDLKKENIELIRIDKDSNKETDLHMKDDLTTSPSAHSYQNIISPQKSMNHLTVEANDAEPMKSSERSFVVKQNRKKEVQSKKRSKRHFKQSSVKDQNKDVILIERTLDKCHQNEDLEQNKENEDDILYVERRYCTVCGFEQPLRAKHCKECQRCVAQYDHHCPWLGTCIGEKNHLTFYCFLILQLIQLSWAEYEVFDEMFSKDYLHWASENTGRIVLACCFTFFFIMVFSLLCYHTYLAFVNLTTWECLSWYKISYLRDWNEDWGSPFSQGAIKNIKLFCCQNNKYFHHWEMPKFKRPLDEQDISP